MSMALRTIGQHRSGRRLGLGGLGIQHGMPTISKIGSGSRLFGLRYLAGCRVTLQLELVDLSFRIRDRGLGVKPCKADFERGKRNAIDDHGF